MTGVIYMVREKGGETPVVGRHVYGELYGCNQAILSDEKMIEEIIREAAEVGGFTLLDVRSWKISPGVSAVGIVLESHISIHTWPEYGFATVDVYTCGSGGDPIAAFKHIARRFEAKKYTMKYTDRSYRE